MRVFKFGGASVKDAEGIRNLVRVLRTVGHNDTLVVVSAMGKTTNALEAVINAYGEERSELQNRLHEVVNFHLKVANTLFTNKEHPVFNAIRHLAEELNQFLKRNKSPNYNYIYDQIVGYGELLSTTIISHYFNKEGLKNNWVDVRTLIKTDDYYRRANVDWEQTQERISELLKTDQLNITQGFLGSDPNNFTTTLGREGSDYTAAIFAYCLNAESVTIWKDVSGVLNADPRYFDQAELLQQISYEEAIELAFYGASVIHPKTLQPLQRKEIPLYVKSFLHPEEKGTTVSKGQSIVPKIPCYIVKKNQVLISLSSLDFSYMVEENLSDIFRLLHHYKMKVDLIQNSAISFSVCVENIYDNLEPLLQHLKAKFQVVCHPNVNLYTIRHYHPDVVADLEQNNHVLLKQQTHQTVQILTK